MMEKLLAEARRNDAETVHFQELARQHRAETRKLSAQAESEEIQAEIERRNLEDVKAHDSLNFVFRFDFGVDSKSVAACISRLNIWRRQNPGQAITIIFTSPGGEVVAGMALFDYLTELRADGFHLTCVAHGIAASMAGILLQAGDRRVVGKESWVLIHQVQASAMGSWGDLQDRMKWLDKVQDRILDIFAKRSAATTGKSFATQRKLFAKNWERTDWWLSSDECLALGVADEIGH
jgi:ATP-dependent protease ClpP protease subunit